MESKPPVSDEKKTPDADATMVIFRTIGDTTWRMFVPSIGLTILGVTVDMQINTTPWMTFGGMALGLIIGTVLVRSQIAKIKRHDEAKK